MTKGLRKIKFDSVASIIEPNEKEKIQLIASLHEHQAVLPSSVSGPVNDEFIIIRGQGFVTSKVNKNGHSVNNKEGFELSKRFPYTFIDLEHKREQIVAVCAGVGYSTYGEISRPLSEKEVIDNYLNTQEPFCVDIIGVVWKRVSPEFCQILIDSQKKDSPLFGIVSLSWELEISEYDLILSKSEFLKDGVIVSNYTEAEKLVPYCKPEGNGRIRDNYVYVMARPPMAAIGMGLVRFPAASVNPVQIIQNNEAPPIIEAPEIPEEEIQALYTLTNDKVPSEKVVSVPSVITPPFPVVETNDKEKDNIKQGDKDKVSDNQEKTAKTSEQPKPGNIEHDIANKDGIIGPEIAKEIEGIGKNEHRIQPPPDDVVKKQEEEKKKIADNLPPSEKIEKPPLSQEGGGHGLMSKMEKSELSEKHIFNLNEVIVPPKSMLLNAGAAPFDNRCCVMVNVPDTDRNDFINFSSKIPDDEIYNDEDNDKGIEKEHHVTALYGIKGVEQIDSVAKVLKGYKKINFKLGNTSAFKREDKPYDVLKVDVESEDLIKLNKELRENTDYSSDFKTYKPHLTLAYLKKGHVDKYINQTIFAGKEWHVDNVIFSIPSKKHLKISMASINTLENDVSQSKNACVSIVTEKFTNKLNNPNMKFNTVAEIIASISTKGDEVLASSVGKFIEEKLAEASTKYAAEVSAKENELKIAQASIKAATEKAVELEATTKTLQTKLASIQEQQEATAKVARFNERMASIEAEYSMDDEARKAVVSSVRDMDDACYGKWKAETFAVLAKFMKKDKDGKKDGKDGDGKDGKDKMTDKEKEAKASEAIIAAVKTAEIVAASAIVPNGVTVDSNKSFKEKFASASLLSLEGVNYNGRNMKTGEKVSMK